jgi:hypothetical protein
MGTHESDERYELVALRIRPDRFVLSLDTLDENEVRVAADTLRPWLSTRIDGLTIIHTKTRRAIECSEVALIHLQVLLDAAGASIVVQVP